MNRLFVISILILAGMLHGMAEESDVMTIRHWNKQTGLSSNRVTALEQDHHGYIWAGTSNGLNRLDGHGVYTWNAPYHPLHHLPVSAIEADEENDCLWIFTPQGMAGCLDLTQNELIPHTPGQDDSLLNRHHKGHLYMWQYGPTLRCSRTRLNKGRLSTETFKKRISDIQTDEEGGDWLLTTRGLYLNGFEERLPASDSVTHIAIYRNLCLAVTPREVVAYNHARRIVRRTPFPPNYRNAGLCTDLAVWGDRLLIFTPDRVVAYHILDGTFSIPTNNLLKNGQVLPESGKHIYAYDGQGRLLRFGDAGTVHPLQLMPTEVARQLAGQIPRVATLNATTEIFATYGNGLHILDIPSGKSSHLRQGDALGAIRDNRIHALLTDHTGCLWIATEQAGVSCLQFNRRKEERDSLSLRSIPQPHITLVAVDGEKRPISPDEMELSYTNNNVEWNFSCMAYDRPDSILYQYRLSGTDSTWQPPTHSHKATYRDLPPGRHRFHVRASLDGLHWGEESTHAVVISEPWWSQWPAILAVLLFVVIMGVFLYLIIYKFVLRGTGDEQQTTNDECQVTEEKEQTTSEEEQITSEEKQATGEEEQTTGEVKQTVNDKAAAPALTAKSERFKERLETVLADHIGDPTFTTEEFAALMNLKRTQFYTRVKAATGLSPVELIRKKHLEQAARLLLETDLNIDEVRERCGFSNSTSFYNYFRQQYGMTPRQYRQNTR